MCLTMARLPSLLYNGCIIITVLLSLKTLKVIFVRFYLIMWSSTPVLFIELMKRYEYFFMDKINIDNYKIILIPIVVSKLLYFFSYLDTSHHVNYFYHHVWKRKVKEKYLKSPSLCLKKIIKDRFVHLCLTMLSLYNCKT